ncbi:hypothetical protein EYR41_009131 [Orbilia oligospora]|uniref:Uncharacterized protein n=1 Tax=Orbilia oligospora TaxID=2813651 RepID=A0A8H2DT31_ORBOL|nr:hypothetical protein EYR41_009131 [Orbilia oligospora]
MLASRSIHNSLTSLGGNVGGGPYPTAPVGPLQIPQLHDIMPRKRSPSLSPKPRSPRYSAQGQPRSRRASPPSHPPPPQHQQQRRPSPPSHNNSYGPGPGSAPISPRPVPNPSTGFPSFTAGRNFQSELQLQNIINWQTVISRNLFDDPPTYQSVLIFLLPSVPSPSVNNFVRQILNTPDHIAHLNKCWEILKRNDREELISFGVPEQVGEIRFEIYRMWLLVRLAWRIVQALKNAKGGSRIAECGEFVMHVIETNKAVSPEKFDPIPLQTLACALTYPHPSSSPQSKIKDNVTPLQRNDRDMLAIEYFEMGFPQNDASALYLPSSIYARAHQARLYRRLELIPEAEEVEQSVRTWWGKTGRTMMPKARFTDLVLSEGEAPYDNIILKNIEGFFEKRSENGSSNGAEEGDSNSGRDSGVDVGPVPEENVERKPGPPPPNSQRPPVRPMQQPSQKPLPAVGDQPAPRLQQKRSTGALPALKPYNPQLPSASTPATELPLPPPRSMRSQAPSPRMQQPPQQPPQQQHQPYPSRPQYQNGSAPSLPASKSYAGAHPYDEYTGSSDSLNSDKSTGKSKVRASIGAKLGFRRRS